MESKPRTVAALTIAMILVVSCRAAEGAAPDPACTGLDYPALTGRVVDQANLLDDAAEARIVGIASGLEAKTKHQLVTVTVPKLQGRDIAIYTRCLGNHWGVGRKEADDGVIILVAPSERHARIEVGIGLEASLTDAEAKTILERDMIPRFKAGQFPLGIEAGARSIVAEIGG